VTGPLWLAVLVAEVDVVEAVVLTPLELAAVDWLLDEVPVPVPVPVPTPLSGSTKAMVVIGASGSPLTPASEAPPPYGPPEGSSDALLQPVRKRAT
jgi:hypothetical protein